MSSTAQVFLQNGLILDGTGTPGYLGSVLLADGRIAALGRIKPPPEAQRIDCSGLVISPGFIDLHSHSDLQVLERRREKLEQGVTTEVVGNCGFSPFPLGSRAELHEFGSGILGRGTDWGWHSASDYLQALEQAGSADSALPLIGHGSLRVAVCGLRQTAATPTELDRMSGLLADALDAGCAGFSTGLMYAPGSSATSDELESLCRVVARKGKLYATHMRSYSEGLLEALAEQLRLAKSTGCRLQISHFQAAGRTNWNLQEPALRAIEEARADGTDVEFDIYPYQCGSTVLTQLLPQWTLDGGNAALIERLQDSPTRARILDEMRATEGRVWSDVTISSVASESNAVVVGKTVDQIANERACPPDLCALDILREESGTVNIISFNQSESNLRQLLTHPLCSVITDGFYVQGQPHPRLYGTYPELLGKLVRDQRWLSLPAAVHKSTGKPAARAALTGRGVLKPNYRADLTVFDPLRIASHSTYANPTPAPTGIRYVIQGGSVVLDAAPPETS